jgi:hypothetical protein
VAYGAAQGLEDNKSTSGVLKNAAVSGALGGVLSAGLQGGSEVLKTITSRKVTSGLYDRAIGATKSQQEKISPGASMLDAGEIGTKRNLLARREAEVNQINGQIEQILMKKGRFQTTEPIISEIKTQIRKKYGLNFKSKQIDQIIENMQIGGLFDNPTLHSTQLNQMKKNLGNAIGEISWRKDVPSESKEMLKIAYGVLAEAVKSNDARLINLFGKESQAIAARGALSGALKRSNLFSNTIEALGSLAFGGAAGGLSAKGVAAAAASFAGVNAAQSTPVRTATAVGLDRLGKVIKKTGNVQKAAQTVGRIIRVNAVKKAGR